MSRLTPNYACKGLDAAFQYFSALQDPKKIIFAGDQRGLSFSQLVELYARQTREFSNAVALLGRHHEIGPEVVTLLDEITRLRIQCFETSEKLERYVRETKPLADAHGAS